jgi:predicted secreted Zn-dependent protease
MIKDIEGDFNKHENHNNILKKEKQSLEDELASLDSKADFNS